MSSQSKKISVKDAFGASMFAAGLILCFIGFSKASGDTNMFDFKGVQQLLYNIDTQNLNWRVFFGGVFMFFGLGLWIFPSQAKINNETGWKPLGME